MTSGDHKIRGEQPVSKGPGCFGSLIIIVALTLLAAIFSKPPSSGPSPPSQKTATFYSDVSALVPLTIAITGGSYILTYVTTDDAELHNLLSGADVFVADFKTGKTFGSLKTATKVLLVGTCSVNVGTFNGFDSLQAKFILENSNFVKATFNASAPSTGPPIKDSIKTIYVIGKIKEFSFDGFKDNSKGDMSVLELDPKDSEVRHYTEEKRDFEKRQEYERVRIRPRIIP